MCPSNDSQGMPVVICEEQGALSTPTDAQMFGDTVDLDLTDLNLKKVTELHCRIELQNPGHI